MRVAMYPLQIQINIKFQRIKSSRLLNIHMDFANRMETLKGINTFFLENVCDFNIKWVKLPENIREEKINFEKIGNFQISYF